MSVSAAFFSPSHRLQVLVQPPRGLHGRHEHLMALRVEQDPPQLLDVRQDEVEQRGAGLPTDVALQLGNGSLTALDQPSDDGRIGLDGGGRAAIRRGTVDFRPGGWG